MSFLETGPGRETTESIVRSVRPRFCEGLFPIVGPILYESRKLPLSDRGNPSGSRDYYLEGTDSLADRMINKNRIKLARLNVGYAAISAGIAYYLKNP